MKTKIFAWSMAFLAVLLQLSARLAARLYSFGFVEEPLIPNNLRLGMELGGSITMIAALIFLARSKNRKWFWGLLGIFSFAGMIVIALLKDRSLCSSRK